MVFLINRQDPFLRFDLVISLDNFCHSLNPAIGKTVKLVHR